MDDLMSCVVCHGSYNLEKNIPKVLRCGHTHCNVCIKKIEPQRGGIRCPLCNVWGRSSEKQQITYPTNFALIQILEHKRNEHGASSFKCSQCEVHGKASEQHICITCVQTEYKVVNVAEQIEEIPEGIDALVLCASCAIKSHCQKKHETMELSALKLDYEYHQNMREIKNLRNCLQEDNRKLARRANETRLLLDSCRAECDHAITLMRDNKMHRNLAMAWPSLKKSFEVLRNTYVYCNIKLAEVNARLIEGIPREAFNLLERKSQECVTTPLRLEPITDTMKFRVPKVFLVDKTIQATEADEGTPLRIPTPECDNDEYDSDEDGQYSSPGSSESRREQRSFAVNIESDESEEDEMDLMHGPSDDGWSGGWETIFSGPLGPHLAEIRGVNSGGGGVNANGVGSVNRRFRRRRPRPY